MTGLAVHGSTDSLPDPAFDFSSNGNGLGPDPFLVRALREVDATRYPDPGYAALCRDLANFEGVDPARIVPGAGISELLLRLARHLPGPLALLVPHFGEYDRCARLAGREVRAARDPEAFLAALPGAGWALLNQPVNPTGQILSLEFLDRVAAACRREGIPLVLDLAYLDLAREACHVPPEAWRLRSPNKAHGLTGVRAGWLVAPDTDTGESLRGAAAAWPVSVHGEAFLRGAVGPDSRGWLAGTLPRLFALADRLAAGLAEAGLSVAPGSGTNFLLASVPGIPASLLAPALRGHGIRVRDALSFGLPGHLRLSAQPEVSQEALFAALREVLPALTRGRTGT